MGRGDVDDPAPPAAFHVGEHSPCGAEGGCEIDGDDRVPTLHRELADRRRVLDAGIVDEDVHATKVVRGMRDHAIDLVRLRHVGGTVGHTDTMLLSQRRPHLFDLGRVAKPVQQHVRALARKGFRDPEADAAGGSGHHGRPALEHPGRERRGMELLRNENVHGFPPDGIASAPAANAAQGAVQPAIHLPHLSVRLRPALVRVRLPVILSLNGRQRRLTDLSRVRGRRLLIRCLCPCGACQKKGGGSDTTAPLRTQKVGSHRDLPWFVRSHADETGHPHAMMLSPPST
jgi:hypothetical protein